MKRRLLAAAMPAVLLAALTGCTALLETGPVIEDDPITARGIDPVEEAIRTWDESHVPYRALPALRPVTAELPDWAQSEPEQYRYWWKSGEQPDGYSGEEVLPGAADLDWQQAANRADAIRRAVGFPADEATVWELTWWPAEAEREWLTPVPPRAYYECMYDTLNNSGDLTLRFDSVIGAVQLLQNNAKDTTGKSAELEAYVAMLYIAGISDSDYTYAREFINGCAAPLADQQTAMETACAALGLPELTWQAIPTDAGTDSLCPLPADRALLDDSCLRWIYGIGLVADGGDGSVWLAEVDRACGVLRGLACLPQEQVPVDWRPIEKH